MTGTETVPTTDSWTLQSAPLNYVVGHVRAVLPDRILEDARIVVRDGRIEEVGPSTPGVRPDVDGGGLLCLPGLVDLHSDGLEKERLPRPGVELPWAFSLMSFEGKVRAAGVTTVFHGASFSDRATATTGRSVHVAQQMCESIEEWSTRDTDARLVDHRVLHRLDVRSAAGFKAMREEFDRLVAVGVVSTATPAVISHEDHTPGIGQYADRTYYENHIAGVRGISVEDARKVVDGLASEREPTPVSATRRWVGSQSSPAAVWPESSGTIPNRPSRSRIWPHAEATSQSSPRPSRRRGKRVTAACPW